MKKKKREDTDQGIITVAIIYHEFYCTSDVVLNTFVFDISNPGTVLITSHHRKRN